MPHSINALNKKHGLCAGTYLCSVNVDKSVALHSDKAYAIVLATGADTRKGNLVTHILFPKYMEFKYFEELPIVIIFLLLYALSIIVAIGFSLKSSHIEYNWINVFT